MYNIWIQHSLPLGFPGGSDSKESTCNTGDLGSIPELGRSPGGGHGNPLQYFCLENPMERGAWRATVYRVAKSQTWLKRLSMHARESWEPVTSSLHLRITHEQGQGREWGERLLLRPPPRPRTSKSWEGAPNTRRFTALPVIPLCSHWGGQASLLLPVPELGEEEEEQTTDKESWPQGRGQHLSSLTQCGFFTLPSTWPQLSVTAFCYCINDDTCYCLDDNGSSHLLRAYSAPHTCSFHLFSQT